MKSVFAGVIFVLAFLSIAILSVLLFTYDVDRFQCEPFKQISNDPALNEILRGELTDFINEEENLIKLEGITSLGVVVLSQYQFDTSFSWLEVFNKYPEHQSKLELALKFDSEMRDLAPPYRIIEVGIYGARSLLMYKNENEDQYLGGDGAVRLSEKPYVKCQVSFESGVPVE